MSTSRLRPETPALVLELASFLLVLKWLRSEGRAAERQVFLAALFSGLAFCFTPRAAFAIFGLGLLAWSGKERWTRSMLGHAAAGAAVGAVVLGATTGFGPFFDWVLAFSRNVDPTFFPLRYVSVFPGWALLAVGACVALWRLLRPAESEARALALMVLVSWGGILVERKAHTYVFAAPYLFSIMLCVDAGVRWWSGCGARPASRLWLAPMALAVLPCLQIPLPRDAFDVPRTLEEQVKIKRAWCEVLKGECVWMAPPVHPVGVRDASYFGYGVEFIANGALKRSGLSPHPPALFEDLRANRPVLISNFYAAQPVVMAEVSDQPLEEVEAFIQRYSAFLAEHYEAAWQGFFVRKDRAREWGGQTVGLSPAETECVLRHPLRLARAPRDLPDEPPGGAVKSKK